MEHLLSVVIGILSGCACFMILRANLVRVMIGLSLLTSSAMLLVFLSGSLTRATPPLIQESQKGGIIPIEVLANPLPQAMILTAVVIGFGLLGFLIALVYRVYDEFHTSDPNKITAKAESESST